MIDRSSSAMPKTAFFVCFLFCGNFILSGRTAEQCPKNPLSPSNSVSGMIVGSIVGVEKLVDGLLSYFYYLGENSINQVIGVSSTLGETVSKYTMKIQDFAMGLLNGIGGQLQSIYNGSTGSIRVLFDYIIKMENSAQSYVYKQVESVSKGLTSGNITGEIADIVKNPFKTVSKGLEKTKGALTKLTAHIQSDVKNVVEKLKTSGVPDDVKDILGAPLRGVKELMKETQTAIGTVRNETSAKLKGYKSDFQSGGVIDKLVAVNSVPVGLTMEAWSLSLKLSAAVKSSISLSVKDLVQPFLGQVLTERLGKIVNLPLDLTEGIYKSTVNSIHNVEGLVARVTGGGSVGDQVNMVVKHPVTVVENAWNTTKQEIRDFSKASLGEELTEQLGSALSSPGKAINSVLSSLTNGTISIQLSSLIDTPIMYLKMGWDQTKMTIGGITKGIIGEKWTSKISDILNAPGKFISDSVSSITGGGSISVQIKTVLTHPLQTVENIIGTVENKTGELITSITGGGSFSEQISTVVTKPMTLVKNIWDTTKKSVKGVSKALVGEGLTDSIGKAITSPLQSLSNVTSSITGGGSFTTQIKMVVTKPFDIIKNVWDKTKSTAESWTKTLLGDDAKNTIINLFTSPLQTVSKIYNSIVSSVSGFGASISISGDGSGEAAGGISGAVRSIIQAPIDLVKGTLKGFESAQSSLWGGIKAIYHSIPIIGKGSLKIEVKDGDEKADINIGGGGEAKSESKAEAGGGWKAKSESKAEAGGGWKAKSESKAEAGGSVSAEGNAEWQSY